MKTAPTKLQIPANSGLRLGTLAVVAALALGTVFLFTTAGGLLADRNTTTVIVAALVFFGILVFAVAYGRARQQPAKWLIFMVWWGLLVSEEVFSYRSDIASGANFASEAYDQAVLWVFALIALLVLVLKYPQSLRGLFQGDYKWVSWLTLVSVLSCAYSPNPAFSLSWAFKLTLVVLVVHICAQHISELGDLRAFISVTIWGFVFLTLLPTLRSIFVPDPTGEYGSRALEQRFREAPTEISGIAGLLAILCLMVYSKGKPKWALWVGGGSLVIMVIAGGKTGIGAGIISGILFFGLQKRFKAVLGFVAGTALILALVLKFTSLSEYASTYLQLEQASSFTGRTDLWAFVMPFILQHPILGQGFIASRFVAVIHPDTPFSSSHMHNSFLETLYNNGLIGLVLVLMINYVIVRNLWRTVRASVSPELRYLAVGTMAAYINLLINAMFNATFGGRPDCSYLMLIAMVVISSQLLRLAQSPSPARVSQAERRLVPLVASPVRASGFNRVRWFN
jgi:exopolysaccharide production protein ExoQ